MDRLLTDGKYVSFTNAPVPLEEVGGAQAFKDVSEVIFQVFQNGQVHLVLKLQLKVYSLD
jgi:hypothetical protein